MDLLDAKNIFKIQDKFGQSELDTFYSFEKNLLLQKLSDQATEEELNEAQESLSQLERAYSVLSCELTSPSAVAEHFQEDKQKKTVNPLLIGIIIGLAGAVAAYFFLAPQHQVTPTPIATSSSNKTPVAPVASEQAKPKIESKNYDLDKLPQEQAMLTVLRQAKEQLKQWQSIAATQGTQLPTHIASLMEEGEDFRKSSRFSQAQLAFEEFIDAIRKHKTQMKSYQSTFIRFNKLNKQWNSLAQANNFKFPRSDGYKKQFLTVTEELQTGKLPSHSRAVLDQICFNYETTIQRGTALAKQHQEYKVLRKQWEQKVLGSSYYTLTPAIEELLATADQTPYYAENFEYLQTQIYPRILNHFKQH